MISSFREYFQKLSFKLWTIPIALLLLCYLAFGLLLPWLGFYQDDWYLAYLPYRYGSQIFISFFEHSRPFLAGIFMLTSQIIGTSALHWQIFNLLTRWLAIVIGWWALRQLWPGSVKQVTWVALLMAIYPGFRQHYLAVVYSQTYIALISFLFSLGVMLIAVRKPRWKLPLTGVALICSFFSMITTEYFFGLEFFRPIFLWIVAGENRLATRERLKTVLINWAPYLAGTIVFFIWRIFFSGSTMYGPKLLEDFSASPGATLLHLIQTFIQDSFDASLFAWVQILEFLKTDLPGFRQILLSWGFAIAVTIVTAFYLLRVRPKNHTIPEIDLQEDRWSIQAIFIGIYSTLFTGWPYWFAGLSVELASGNDRFTLAYTFGAAILIAGLIDLLIKNDRYKIFMIATIVGFSTLFHLRNGMIYRDVHLAQQAFYQQLVWRAPHLESGTKLLMNEFPVDYSGNASIDAAYKWVYTPAGSYTGEEYELMFIPGKIGSAGLPDLSPGSNRDNVLVAYYDPPGCVQIIDPNLHMTLPKLPEVIREAAPISNLNRIKPDAEDSLANMQIIFGKEMPPNWCYYFEKADLARQNNDWAQVLSLGEDAFQNEHKPYDKYSNELLPFIEGYARLGKLDEAINMTKDAIQDVPALRQTLCDLWAKVLVDTPLQPEPTNSIEKLEGILNCALP